MFEGIIKEAKRSRTDVVVKVRAKPSMLGKLLEAIAPLKKDPGVFRVYHHKKKIRLPKMIYGVRVSRIKDKIGYGVTKPKDQIERLKKVSIGVDKRGFFVYTHRARSKSYPTIVKIPDSRVKFIESTG